MKLDCESSAPRLVLRGANNHTITIDWLRVVIPQQHVGEASNKFDDLFGPHQQSKGRFGLRTGREWGSGAFLAVDTPKEGMTIAPHAVVELSGSTLAPMTNDDKVGLLAFLLSIENAHATRLDIARDHHGSGIDLIEHLTNACHAGELTGAKRYEPAKGYRIEHGKPVVIKEMLSIGTRGKNGSGRYLRVYDKGLETKQQPRGEWVRWELELSKSNAQAAAIAIAQSEDPDKTMEEYALGAIDFRESNGKRLRDRRRCEWWQLVIDGVETRRDTMKRRKPDADRYARWLKHAALPSLYAYAEALDLTVTEFVEVITNGVEPNYKKLDTPLGRQVLYLTPRKRGAA